MPGPEPKTESYYDKQIRELKLQQAIIPREIDAYQQEKDFFMKARLDGGDTPQ